MKYHPPFWKFFRDETLGDDRLVNCLKGAFKECWDDWKIQSLRDKFELLFVFALLIFYIPIIVYKEWREKRKPLVDEFIENL